MIKITHIIAAINKLEDAGADMDDYVLVITPGSPLQFYIMLEKDFKI